MEKNTVETSKKLLNLKAVEGKKQYKQAENAELVVPSMASCLATLILHTLLRWNSGEPSRQQPPFPPRNQYSLSIRTKRRDLGPPQAIAALRRRNSGSR
jgi:hypothetical protein